MFAYIVRRLLFVPPTLFVIILINFAVVQVLPGGPVEQMISEISGEAVRCNRSYKRQRGLRNPATPTVLEWGRATRLAPLESKYRGAQGLPPEFIAELEKQFGLRQARTRAVLADAEELHHWCSISARAYFQGRQPSSIWFIEKMPVSISH